ncbi:MAG: terminase small subunit [Oscillospiraceae bacterium]|jgi:hypothetical protein|nr:terminase small subunit [Oscillospiraceae bacterium]
MGKGLTKRERAFCYYYVSTGNALESARLSGFGKKTVEKCAEILGKETVSSELERLFEKKKKYLRKIASIGYERLAFGGISDCLRLICSENLESLNLENMDLFCVSEIKKSKDGAMEIKFFDRIKALEKLENINLECGINPVYKALEQSLKLNCESLPPGNKIYGT